MRAKGIDISKWQQIFNYQDNVDFVIMKATEGWGYTDAKFREFLAEAMKVPIRGAYHYFRTGYEPERQAKHFYETVKDHPIDFYVVDYEETGNDLYKSAEIALGIFWNTLTSLTDKPVLLYTSVSVLYDKLIRYNDDWELVPLWIAHWKKVNPDTAEPGTPTKPINAWKIWQHSADGNGHGLEYGVGSNDVDMNVYNGTLEEMKEWLKIEEVEPEPVPEPDPNISTRTAVIHECIAALRELL